MAGNLKDIMSSGLLGMGLSGGVEGLGGLGPLALEALKNKGAPQEMSPMQSMGQDQLQPMDAPARSQLLEIMKPRARPQGM